ncbi:MAG: PqqD family protein [Thermoplasmatota archaeon]
MSRKMKRSIPEVSKDSGMDGAGKGSGSERPWWARSDDELVRERAGKLKDWYSRSKITLDDGDRDQLIREAARRDPRIENLLDKVVKRSEGIVRQGKFLVIPIYTSERGRKIAGFLGLRTKRRVRLDEYGWEVWTLIDGRRDVRSIGRLLHNRYGEDIDPLYPRLAKFLAYLENLKLVRIVSDG